MKFGRVGLVVCCCLLALAAVARGQSRKPGLWEVTTQMHMSMAGAPQMPAHTSQVCVTQAMIDKYGGPISNPNPQSQCQVTDVSLKSDGMSAKMSCTGRQTMTGTIQMTFVDANTTKTTVQMSMSAGGNSMTITTESTASYKGPDCGDVKPITMPSSSN